MNDKFRMPARRVATIWLTRQFWKAWCAIAWALFWRRK